jgi:hypothetical protein
VVPPSIEVGQGQFVEIGIAVDNVTGMNNVDIRLLFDPNILAVVDDDEARSGVQIIAGQIPYPDDVWANIADNYAGTIQYAVAQFDPHQPFTGSATVCSVRFHAKAQGTSPIEIITIDEDGEAIAVLGTEDEEAIAVTVQHGEIIVTEEGKPPLIPPSPPTFTPTTSATDLQANPAPSSTPTLDWAYPMGTPPPPPPVDTPALLPGYPDPSEDSYQPSPEASAATLTTAAVSTETLPDAPLTPAATLDGSAQGTYPGLVDPLPTALPVESEATANVAATTDAETPATASDATPIASPALTATDEPVAAPTEADAPPPVESAMQPKPLIPRGLFFVLVAGLALFTGRLFVRLWRNAGES